jgi:hypothetical protein
MRWRICGGEKRSQQLTADSLQLRVQKKEFYTESAESTEFTEKKRKSGLLASLGMTQ